MFKKMVLSLGVIFLGINSLNLLFAQERRETLIDVKEEERWLHASDEELARLKQTEPEVYDRLIARHRALEEEFEQFKREHAGDWWLVAPPDKMLHWRLTPNEFEKLSNYRPELAENYLKAHPNFEDYYPEWREHRHKEKEAFPEEGEHRREDIGPRHERIEHRGEHEEIRPRRHEEIEARPPIHEERRPRHEGIRPGYEEREHRPAHEERGPRHHQEEIKARPPRRERTHSRHEEERPKHEEVRH